MCCPGSISDQLYSLAIRQHNEKLRTKSLKAHVWQLDNILLNNTLIKRKLRNNEIVVIKFCKTWLKQKREVDV